MQLSRAALVACFAVPVALAFALPATKLAFAPKGGAESKKTLTLEADLSIVDLSGDVNGQPLPPEASEQLTSQGLLLTMATTVTDVYSATKDGRPVELLRTYDALDVDIEMGEETASNEEMKAIEGKTIKFTWDEKEGSYSKSYHESEGEAELIKELEADMDLLCLLPGKDLDEGDSWEVPAKDLGPLFLPGGMLSAGGADQADGPDMSAMVEEMRDEFEKAAETFKVTCLFKGVSDKDGVKVGEVSFVFDGKMSMDLSDMIQSAIEAQGGEEMPPMDISFNMGMGMKGEGVLWWNLAENRLHAYEMEASAEMDMAMEMSMDQGGQSMSINMSGKAKGDMTWTLEPAEAKKADAK
ncbi:MAG: hypothetical protein RL112_1342 [Planctomycetota bacterium]